MFNFVCTDEEIDRADAAPEDGKYFPVTESDIAKVEKKFNITFPDILKDYYLKHNGKFINCVKIQEPAGGTIYEITGIFPIIGPALNKYGLKNDFSVECIKDKEMKEPEEFGYLRIRNNFIPLGIDQGGNLYYWDSNDGKVYISYNADEDENGLEIPYYVCSSVEEMFRLMDEVYDIEIKEH